LSPRGNRPDTDLTLGFVDAGRLGGSLAEALHQMGHRVVALSRRDPGQADALARRLGDDVVGTTDPQAVVTAANVVFITSIDDLLAQRATELTFRESQWVLHCSGATSVSVLAPARRAGASTGGFHPLQTFPDDRGAARFTGVTFGVESEEATLLRWLRETASGLGGWSVTLDDECRPLYHASAVMAGPMVSALIGLAADLWGSFGQNRHDAVAALAPLLLGTAHHVRDLGIPAAMTGPYVRGDQGPVRAHLEALSGCEPDTLRAYASLAMAQLPIAAERGNIPEDRMRELRELLEGALTTYSKG
jgi:predicted short-subunit dehydrogenase-like oxidoreductase (DUF2520 family)